MVDYDNETRAGGIVNKLTLAIILFGCLPATAQGLQQASSVEEPREREVFARHTDLPIKLDGVLDETIWAEVEPGRGDHSIGQFALGLLLQHPNVSQRLYPIQQ